MGILNIAPAERAGAHLLIQLYGPSRSGKTYTALRIARGMVGPKGKIGMLDTESGRARLYSDKVPGGFVLGELTPPYTPRRYLEAIEEFLAYGVDILVVDSFSHCWEGPGGVLEMADQAESHGWRYARSHNERDGDFRIEGSASSGADWTITSFSITEEAHDTLLNPIRAKVSLGMRVLSVNDVGFLTPAGALYMVYQVEKEALSLLSL